MREPSAQTRLLASAPVFFGTWGVAAWSVYQWMQHPAAWPLALTFGLGVVPVMKADEQVRKYKAWKRDWEAMNGAAAPPRGSAGRTLATVIGIVLGVLLIALLFDAGKHGGGQAVVGVLLVLGVPILAMAGLVRLWRMARRGRTKRAARVQPVGIAVRGPLLPVPPLRAAYEALPPYCQHLLQGQR